MSRYLFVAVLALAPIFPTQAQEPAHPVKLVATNRTELSLRDALAGLFEKQKVPFILGPGIEGKVTYTVDIAALPLDEAVALLLAAADKPVQVEIRKSGVWILKLAPTAPPAPPQVNVAPAQVTVNNLPPKSPTIASLNVSSSGDPVLAVLELQVNLLEQEFATAKSSFGSDSEVLSSLKNQLETVRRQLVLRRAQATKKSTASATPSKKR